MEFKIKFESKELCFGWVVHIDKKQENSQAGAVQGAENALDRKKSGLLC